MPILSRPNKCIKNINMKKLEDMYTRFVLYI